VRPKVSLADLICRTDQCFQRQRLPYTMRCLCTPGIMPNCRHIIYHKGKA